MMIGVKEAADRAGLSQKTIRRAIKSGDLRAYKPGGRPQNSWRIDEEDLKAWLVEASKVEAKPADNADEVSLYLARRDDDDDFMPRR